jgi:eukaryotic-like serine/threonine-protein kinase
MRRRPQETALVPPEETSAEPVGLPQREPSAEVDARLGVEIVASEFVDRLRAGQQPTIEEYLARFPQYATELADLLPLMTAMERWKEDRQQLSAIPPLPPAFDMHRLGDCRILREIGRGGMGIVVEGIQESLGRRVAVKLLPMRFGRDVQWRQRFRREARLAASLRHSNIVPVYRFGEYENFCYYVMPFIVGMGLDWVIERLKEPPGWIDANQIEQARMGVPTGDAIAASSGNSALAPVRPPETDGGPLPEDPLPGPAEEVSGGEELVVGAGLRRLRAGSWKKIAKMGAQAAAALRYAHGRGLLHRDIKPANLLLDTSGTVWVTDFGLAQRIEQIAETPSIAGTLRYMPPEQLEGHADERSDIYSLGVTLYELVTLRPAFEGDSRAELRRQIRSGCIRPLGECSGGIPDRLAEIISKAVATDPDDRFGSADEMAAALVDFLDRKPEPPRPQNWLSRLMGGSDAD